MARSKSKTSSAKDEYKPRKPTGAEKRQLVEWLADLGDDEEFAEGCVHDACISVFDHYITSGVGYAGKVMTVVWDGSPTFYDSFTWDDGELVLSPRERDDCKKLKCDICGCFPRNPKYVYCSDTCRY